MKVTLSVTEGPHKGRDFTFREYDNFIVGRAPCAHFRLPLKDKFFSRVHFMVEVNPPRCRLMDMGSTNGTRVNGRKLSKSDLKDGDLIKGGETVIRVTIEDDPDSSQFGTTGSSFSQLAWEHAAARPPMQTKPPSLSTVSVPAKVQVPPSQPLPGIPSSRCRTCGAPAVSVGGTVPLDPGKPPSTLICPSCTQQIRNHPQPIAGYQIVRELGRGGMGVVYLALREADRSPVALKTITPAIIPSEKDVAGFLREANILRELDHPNIVACRDVGEMEGQLFFAMEYIQGVDARRLLEEQGGPLSIDRSVGLGCQLLEALEYAHARQFVHRDIKPANLLVMRVEERDVVKLADFGLARVYQASRLSGLTMTGEAGGTPAFMAPEQITHYREAMPATDLYAVGATLYKLLTDRYVYDFLRGRPEAKYLMILQDDPVPIQSRRSEIPRDLILQR
jgi:serine/threonine-protein kinase